MIKKTAALLLALCLCVGCLCACGKELILRYGKMGLTEGMVHYLYASLKNDYLSTFSDITDSEEGWNQKIDESQTYAEFIDQEIRKTIYQMVIAAALFDENGYQLTSEGEEQISELLDSTIEAFGGRSALNAELSAMGLDDKELKKVFTMQYKYEKMRFESDFVTVEDQDREAYYQDKYACVKFIYVNLVKEYEYDEDGEKKVGDDGYYIMRDMTEAEKEEKKQDVQKMEQAIEQDPSRYEELYESENGIDVTYYPHGFYINADNLYALQLKAVSDVAFGLEIDGVKTVYDDYGAYIVKRCALPEKAYEDSIDYIQFTDMDEYCRSYVFLNLIEEKYDGVEINEEKLDQFSVKNVQAVTY